METIIAAAISGGLALIGVIFTNIMQGKKIEKKLEIAQAVTDQKIEDLTREVRKHNNFAERIPKVEQQIDNLDKKISFLHRND
ncbi:MAG: hypothetical protein IKJ65_01980 [Clostridia bacterium]|nr:hypothetical protein [Clostridia bacterium]